MAVGFILLNAGLMGALVLVITGGIFWAIATQHRDHGVASAGPLLRRRLWSPSVHRQATVNRPRASGAYWPHANPTW